MPHPEIDPLDIPPGPESFAPPPDPSVVGGGLKWAYAALSFGAAAASLAGLQAKQLHLEPADLDSLHLFGFWLLPAASLVVGAFWLFAAWGELLPDRRGGTSTLMVGALLFVPVLGFTWLHEVHQRLCAGIAHTLTELGEKRPAPDGLASIASLLLVVLFGAYLLYPERTFLPFVANSAAWFLYMHECDTARTALKAAKARLELAR